MSNPVRDIVEKCGRTGQVTDDIIIWRMRFACLITKTRLQTPTGSI